MNKIKLTISFFVIVLLNSFVTDVNAASKSNKTMLDTGNVKQQIEYVIKKSTTYDLYKVVKVAWINRLKTNVLDSLSASKLKYNQSQQALFNEIKTVDSLSSTLEATQSKLTNVIKEKNSLKLMGVSVSKTSYNTVMSFVLIGLLSILTFLFMAFRRSNRITINTKKELEEVTVEFASHKKRAREREEQNARKHLDEILKYKEKRHSKV